MILKKLAQKESTVEVPTLLNKGRRLPSQRWRVAYKYNEAWRFLADLMTTHTPGELQDLLAADMEFLELGMVKIKREHPVLGFDQLCASLETRRSTHFDV